MSRDNWNHLLRQMPRTALHLWNIEVSNWKTERNSASKLRIDVFGFASPAEVAKGGSA